MNSIIAEDTAFGGLEAEHAQKRKAHMERLCKKLRNMLCSDFENLDGNSSAKFKRKSWKRTDMSGKIGGGGQMSIMRGNILEKVGVNISTVWGKLPEKLCSEVRGTRDDSAFWATGLSVVCHPKSPKIPAAHLNLRLIFTQENWLGGACDLNPAMPNKQQTHQFHQALKEACEHYKKNSYQEYSKACHDYFYIPHRKKHRGVGGIFFDGLASGDFDKDLDFIKQIANAFRYVYSKIIQQNAKKNVTEKEYQKLMIWRALYTEFNLVYDRGTRFGLMTGGNPEAVLMSLPPKVFWP